MGNITANICDAGTKGLQINWHYDGLPRRQYHIDKQNIFSDGAEIRTALQALIDAWRSGQRENYATLLRAVALRGFQLYTDIVFAVGDQTQSDNAAWIKDWLANTIDPRQDTLTFRVPEGIYVPWGLVYDDPNIQKSDSEAVPESYLVREIQCGDELYGFDGQRGGEEMADGRYAGVVRRSSRHLAGDARQAA
jgi:hypothetical protein